MSIEQEYKKNNMDVQQRIRLEIENIKKGNSKRNLDQLNAILEELRKTLSNKNLPLSFPRIIVDSWDFQDKLGIDLLKVAELYKQWK